jgi:hypothetical protein
MAEEYLLKVAKDAEKDSKKMLTLSSPPTHLRLATIAPLSNYGYPAGVEGCILKVGDAGIVIGADGREDIPRDFVPWSNVAYVSDGSALAKEQAKE